MRASAQSLAVLLVFLVSSEVQAQTDDLLGIIAAQPGMADRLGLAKLTDAEKAAWNEVLNLVFQAASQEVAPRSLSRPTSPSTGGSGTAAYKTEITDDDGDVLQLSNGAIVEVASGFLGFIGFRPDAVLFRQGQRWRIWIEGKRTFPVRLLKQPAVRGTQSAETVSIGEVLGGGAILRLADGRILEVDLIDRIYTGIWLGYAEALLIGRTELLNLDNGELVRISAIR